MLQKRNSLIWKRWRQQMRRLWRSVKMYIFHNISSLLINLFLKVPLQIVTPFRISVNVMVFWKIYDDAVIQERERWDSVREWVSNTDLSICTSMNGLFLELRTLKNTEKLKALRQYSLQFVRYVPRCHVQYFLQDSWRYYLV